MSKTIQKDVAIIIVDAELAAAFVKQYKYPQVDANDFFYESLIKNPDVCEVIVNSKSSKQLSKNSIFKNFVKQHKKELYYRLRQYKGDNIAKDELVNALVQPDLSEENRIQLLRQLASFHVSSTERYPVNRTFYDLLSKFMDDVHSVIDIGCGVQPVFFPHVHFPQVNKYVALDKDKDSIQILDAFKNAFPTQYQWLYPRVWNIGNGWKDVNIENNADSFDLALILKVVPVIKRTSPALLDELINVPAKTMVIRGVKESMVKKQDIEHKERRAIERFIQSTGREKTGEFELDNEFFIIVQ